MNIDFILDLHIIVLFSKLHGIHVTASYYRTNEFPHQQGKILRWKPTEMSTGDL